MFTVANTFVAESRHPVPNSTVMSLWRGITTFKVTVNNACVDEPTVGADEATAVSAACCLVRGTIMSTNVAKSSVAEVGSRRQST